MFNFKRITRANYTAAHRVIVLRFNFCFAHLTQQLTLSSNNGPLPRRDAISTQRTDTFTFHSGHHDIIGVSKAATVSSTPSETKLWAVTIKPALCSVIDVNSGVRFISFP